MGQNPETKEIYINNSKIAKFSNSVNESQSSVERDIKLKDIFKQNHQDEEKKVIDDIKDITKTSQSNTQQHNLEMCC